MSKVYLIHFSEKFQNKCQHYLGYTEKEVEERLNTHKSGNGTRLLRAVNKTNINYEIVRI